MKILLIIDQFDSANNGTTISARRFADVLRSHGNEVRVLASGKPAQDKYALPRVYFLPIAQWIISSQGMQFAVPVADTIREALAWCDVAHFMMPFALGIRALKLAEEMGVPHTAAFHVQPENVTSSIGLANSRSANEALYSGFRNLFYRRFTHIHCPSKFIAGQLRAHGYSAQLHVISNGISPIFTYEKREKSAAMRGKFMILMIGRLSREKRQDIIIDAVKRSKYANEIQLVFAGKGPKFTKLKQQGESLPNRPIFCFLTPEKLHALISMCDLYVHAADAEIEAIACMEAFASGLVPIIANSPKSATPQFALDERSLFQAGSPDDLVQKIEYWMEHPVQRAEMEYTYAEYGKQYNIDACVSKAENMFKAAIEEQKRAMPHG